MGILISPSILSADFGKINQEIANIEPLCDRIHVDVMDGHFVPNITFGPPVIAKFKCKRPMDVHLMIENPEEYLEAFADAIQSAHGGKKDSSIIVHQETCPHLSSVIKAIKKLGCRAGIALNPLTPAYTIEPVLKECDLVLVMSVNPGFGGQGFIESVVPKIITLRQKAPKIDIAVDGGINAETAKKVAQAGANILVAGNYIFKAKNREEAIRSLRQ